MAKNDWKTIFQVVDLGGMSVKTCCEAIKNSSLSADDKSVMLEFMGDVAIEMTGPMLSSVE